MIFHAFYLNLFYSFFFTEVQFTWSKVREESIFVREESIFVKKYGKEL